MASPASSPDAGPASSAGSSPRLPKARMLAAGYALMALSGGWPVGGFAASRISVAISYRAAVIAGGVVIILGSAMMILLDPSRTFADFGAIEFTPLAKIAEAAVERWKLEGVQGGYTHLKVARS